MEVKINKQKINVEIHVLSNELMQVCVPCECAW